MTAHRRRRPWMSMMLCTVAVLAGVALMRARGAEDEEKKSPLEGKAAPEVSLPTLDGKTFKLSDEKKNVVVLDFWATWCPPCRLSLPHVQELSQKKELADKGLKVYAVNAQEEKDEIQTFLKKNNYTFAVPMDSAGAAMKAYGVQGIPTTVVVGRDGTVKKVFVGFNPQSSPKALDDAIEAALKDEAK